MPSSLRQLISPVCVLLRNLALRVLVAPVCEPKPFCISDTTTTDDETAAAEGIFLRGVIADSPRFSGCSEGRTGQRLEEKLCVDGERGYYNIGGAVVNEERTNGGTLCVIPQS